MNNKRELLIVPEEQKEWKKGEHEVRHPLYLDGYKAGLKSIFTKAYDMEESINLKSESYDRVIRDEQNNILSFIGKRGSGKTTAMDEFCRILKSLDNQSESIWWLNETTGTNINDCLRNRRFKFHILNPIDASLFDESRDLFEQIIANIYRYFDKYSSEKYFDMDQESGTYLERYSDIMKRYYSNKVDQNDKGSAFSLANMISFASDNNEIQEKIIELINIYLNNNRKFDYEYIVITIDDIDLNIRHGYSMLEQIQKYFAYYKIIILVSMDYDQMRMVCEKHFWNCLGAGNRINSEKYNKQYIKNLTKDVMTKIFHISQRIYLPDLAMILKRTYVIEKKFENSLSIKGFVIRKISEKLMINYDLCGKKRHFVEPETIREFVVYMDFLDSLYSIEKRQLSEKNNGEILKMYDINYKLFINDIIERMAQNLLTAEQLVAFRKLQLRDVDRRTSYFVNSFIDEEGNIIFGNIDDQQNSKKLNKAHKSINASEYSYGDLLERIYLWGRNPDRDCFDDKPYIWCVLAMFTTDMTNEYIHYKIEAIKSKNMSCINQQEKYYKERLLNFIGQSFGNEWLKAAFPKTPNDDVKISTNADTKFFNHGYNKVLSISTLEIPIPDEIVSKKYLKLDEFKKCIADSGIIQTMAVMDMCFSKIKKGNINRIHFKFKKYPATDENKRYFYIGAEEDTDVNLDMLSFILKSFEYKKWQNEFIKNIERIIEDIVIELEYSFDNIREDEWREFIIKNLPFSYIDDDLDDVAFPFYNLDISYNVLKRVRKELANYSSTASNLYTAMNTFYGELYKLLKQEDEEYKKLGIETEFSDNYDKCPFIHVMLDSTNDEIKEIINRFEDILNRRMTLTQETDAEVSA